MAAPSYTTDLSTWTLMESGDTVGEFTDYDEGGTPIANDTDDIIQGSYHASAECKLKTTELQSIYGDAGSSITVSSGDAILMWFKFDAGGILESFANGGLRIMVGTSAAVWSAWKAGGNDYAPNPNGGWYNFALDPNIGSPDYTKGTVTTFNLAGMACTLTVAGPSKGYPFKMDAIRYGRCQLIFTAGDGTTPATFTGAAAKNDANDATDGYNRWGLLENKGGNLLNKGMLQLGTSTTALHMEDSNQLIFIDDTVNVASTFNTIEINHASTNITWDNIIFKALGTNSPGRLVMNANATLAWDGCQFFDMGAFSFGGSNSVSTNTIWQGCGLITVNNADITGSKILASTVAADASAIDWDVNVDPDGYLDNLTISEGTNSHHAIEFGSSCPASMTIRGLNVGSDFAATNSQTNSTFYISDSSTSNNYTISCVGCTGNMTYKSAGAGVTIVSDPVTVKVTATDASGTEIQNARVMIRASDGTGPFPYQETVTIVNSGTTATVSHTGHGMATNDKVLIAGASLSANKGIFSITLDGTTPADKYSYTMSSTPGSSPTGTITSTFVALSGLTDVNGEISTSRVYSTDQPVTGWARKSSGSPYYKTGPLGGAVDSADGYNNTAVLTADE